MDVQFEHHRAEIHAVTNATHFANPLPDRNIDRAQHERQTSRIESTSPILQFRRTNMLCTRFNLIRVDHVCVRLHSLPRTHLVLVMLCNIANFERPRELHELVRTPLPSIHRGNLFRLVGRIQSRHCAPGIKQIVVTHEHLLVIRCTRAAESTHHLQVSNEHLSRLQAVAVFENQVHRARNKHLQTQGEFLFL